MIIPVVTGGPGRVPSHIFELSVEFLITLCMLMAGTVCIENEQITSDFEKQVKIK